VTHDPRDDQPRPAPGATPEAGPPIEETLAALESVVTRLERCDLGLEEALAAFEEGVRLARQCESRLDRAERRVELLLRQPDGSLRAEPFDPDGRGASPDGGE
jgi:exodeoxyribonuclease VII small subunit